MTDREWEKQELEAMERLALSRADRARWDSLDPKGLLPSRIARKLSGLKELATRKDPLADYEVESSAAFRVPFKLPAGEQAEAPDAGPASSAEIAASSRPGILPLRRKPKEKRRLFRR